MTIKDDELMATYSQVPLNQAKDLTFPVEPLEISTQDVLSLPQLGRERYRAKNFLHSVGFACEGLSFVARSERNFRIDLVMAALVFLAGALFQLSWPEWTVLSIMIGAVLSAEALNTAIEMVVDLVTQGEFDMRAKAIKDTSAGACLIVSCTAAIVGGFVFIPHVLAVLPVLTVHP
jgi:diacylglycerol kinase